MKELVEFIVKSLVDNPEKLVITTEEEGEVLKIFIISSPSRGRTTPIPPR